MFKQFLIASVLLAMVTVIQANNSSIEVNNETFLNDSEYEYDPDYDQGDDQDYCNDGSLVERVEGLLLPEDTGDEGENVKYEQATIESLLDAYVRLGQYRQNVSEKLSSINKIVINKLKDKFFYLDISSECISTLRRIFEGINAGQPWASKCKHVRILM